MKDKVRIHFTHENQLYQQWIEFDYPENILNNKEQKEAFRFDFLINTCMPILKKKYEEVTGKEYKDNVQIRDIYGNDENKLNEIFDKLNNGEELNEKSI